MTQRRFSTALKSYISGMEKKKRAELTREHYRAYLEHFKKTERIQFTTDITEGRIRHYQKFLKDMGLGDTTQNYYLIALRNFLKYLPKTQKKIGFKLVELNKVMFRPAAPPSRRTVVDCIVKARTNTSRSEILQARDSSIIELLLRTNTSLQTLPELKLKHFNPRSRLLLIPRRGNRTEKIKLPAKVAQSIHDYIELRADDNSYLFIAHDRAVYGREKSDDAPMTTRSIQRLIKSAALQSGVADLVSPRTIKRVQ